VAPLECQRQSPFGVPSYWIVDPDPGRPELTVFELSHGRCALAAQTTQAVTLSRPFRVTVSPADLTRGLRG
jgi:Uma2 family endonuclease